MRFTSSLVAFGVAVASATFAAPLVAVADGPAAPPPVVVDRGILVRVVLDHDVSSGKTSVGDEFPVHVVDDVVSHAYVVVKAGAPGVGRITAVTPAGRGTPGSLTYEFVYVMAVDGKKLRITSSAAAVKPDAPRGDDETSITGGVAQAATSAASGQAVAATADAASNVGPVAGPVTGAVAGSLASSVTSSLFGGPKRGRDAVLATKTLHDTFVADTVHVASTVKATPAPKPTDDGYAH